MVDIKKNIEEILKQKRLSGAEVARRMGIERSNFYQIVGRDNIGLENLKKISKALSVKVSELVKDAEDVIKIDQIPVKGNSKVIIQIEIDPKQENNTLKMIFGTEFFNQIKK